MGNSLDGAEAAKAKVKSDAQAESYFTQSEKNVIKAIFDKIHVELSISKVSSVFGDLENTFLSECIYHWIKLKNITSLNAFEDLIAKLTRVESNRIIKLLWDIIASHPKVNNGNKVFSFFTLTLILSVPSTFFVSEDLEGHSLSAISIEAQRMTEFFNNCIKKQDSNFNIENTNSAIICGWINNYSPHCPRVFESFITLCCFKDVISPSFKPFLAPILISTNSAFTQGSILNELELLPLALSNPNLQDIWQRLYSSAVDGTSFNRIVHHILGYEGPTCIIIRCRDAERTVLGAYTADRWKEHNKFYGSSSNMLFTLKPKVRLYRPKGGSNGNYQYLNTTGYSLPHGLGLGGTIEGFRLFIPESLESCTASSSCPTYEAGKFVEGNTFEIDSIEIWGCGGSEKVSRALKSQLKEREITNEAIQKARKVDRGQFFGNAFDQEFFLANTMQHKTQQSDRVEIEYNDSYMYKGNINVG